ncbi:hypothetical protein LJR220_006635 [Bradyrhizobium sp. LjRoot220]|uniref:hypothetical protein n=1 Tax=Bradyrhizobium sp. LjRoot220 TaxID=3342284 RepID=UPI003ECC5015
MPEAETFLVRSGQNVISHCERLLASSTSHDESERLRRLIGKEEKFLASLARLSDRRAA